MCEHFLTVQLNNWFTPIKKKKKNPAKAVTIMNVFGKKMNLSACKGDVAWKADVGSEQNTSGA